MTLYDQDSGSLGALFGIPGAPSLTAIPMQQASFSVTHIVRHVPQGTVADVCFAPSDVYLLMLYMGDTRHCDVMPNGNRGNIRRYRQGRFALSIWRRVQASSFMKACMRSPLFCLALSLMKWRR